MASLTSRVMSPSSLSVLPRRSLFSNPLVALTATASSQTLQACRRNERDQPHEWRLPCLKKRMCTHSVWCSPRLAGLPSATTAVKMSCAWMA